MAIKAVEMTREIRDANYKRTFGMTKEEKLRLIHEEASEFLQKTEKVEAVNRPVKRSAVLRHKAA
ncbi:MAG: hypothetical protein WCP20_08840 [Desulfuromonadales bacterium]